MQTIVIIYILSFGPFFFINRLSYIIKEMCSKKKKHISCHVDINTFICLHFVKDNANICTFAVEQTFFLTSLTLSVIIFTF